MADKIIKLKPLKGHNAFAEHFPGGKKFYHGDMSLSLRLRDKPAEDVPVLYYGVSVSKRHCKKAVVRNRLKRLMRQSLRQYVAECLSIAEMTNSQQNDDSTINGTDIVPDNIEAVIIKQDIMKWESVILFWKKSIAMQSLVDYKTVNDQAIELFHKAHEFSQKRSESLYRK
jgi:ribonuclease P protein component